MVMVSVEELLLLLLLLWVVVMVPWVAAFVLLQMVERVVRMLRQVVLSMVHLMP